MHYPARAFPADFGLSEDDVGGADYVEDHREARGGRDVGHRREHLLLHPEGDGRRAVEPALPHRTDVARGSLVGDAGCDGLPINYLHLIAPESKDIVKLYNGEIPIFDNFGVTKQIKSSFGRTVTYRHGAYLIIEHTEALHVVDVNSGNRAKNPDGQEANALEVNMGAADELARQLRLRDMGGIIVVDFIDMTLAEDRQKLYERMNQAMQNDRARHNILPLSKFGLMQITRQRVRPATEVEVEETCPTCGGTGKIRPSLLFVDMLSDKVEAIYNSGMRNFTLHVHPYVYAYIYKGIFSILRKWKLRYKFTVKVIPNQSLGFLEYKFIDKVGNEIPIKEHYDMK